MELERKRNRKGEANTSAREREISKSLVIYGSVSEGRFCGDISS